MKWELLMETAEETAAREAKPHWTEEHPVRKDTLHCPCGRFAKYVGAEHYYNGQFDCYRYTVRCSRCGDVDIECV